MGGFEALFSVACTADIPRRVFTAAISALAEDIEGDFVREYLEIARKSTEHAKQMHKVVLQVTNEAKLINLSNKLKEAEIGHRVWVWQHESLRLLSNAIDGRLSTQR